MVLDDQLVRRDANVERVVLAPAVSLYLTLLLRAEVREDLETRAPAFDLHLPVHDDSGRHDDQVRTPNAIVTCKRRKHRDSLNSLAEAHLIRKDTVQLAIVQCNEPIETNDLVLTQRSSQQERYLRAHCRLVERVAGRLEVLD